MTMTAGTEMSGRRSCWTWVAAKIPAPKSRTTPRRTTTPSRRESRVTKATRLGLARSGHSRDQVRTIGRRYGPGVVLSRQHDSVLSRLSRLGGFHRADADQEQPRAGDHEDERRHHPQPHDVEARCVAEKQDDGAGLFQHQAGEAADRAPQHAPVGAAHGLPDAAVEDQLDDGEDHDDLDRDGPEILAAHQAERAANEDRGEAGEDRPPAMPLPRLP